MKLHNKIFTICLFLMTSLSISSQKLALEGGYFNPQRHGTALGQTYIDNIRLGLHAELPWKYNLGVLSGVYYNLGYASRSQAYPNDYSVNYNSWIHSVEIPVRAMYRIHFSKNFGMFVYGGPNVQIGILHPTDISANLSQTLTNLTGIVSEQIDEYSEGRLNRLNFQLGTGGGFQYKSYILKGGYDWGLNNLDKTNTGNLYQQNWYTTFAWEF